jgi:acyl-CoA oxidase
MVHSAAWGIAHAATIAIRYSAVRLQGFKNTRENSLQSGEFAVLDYQVQQYRLFKALSSAYAFHFVYQQVKAKLNAFRAGLEQGDVSQLPELHATVAGLKAFCTNIAGDLMEECRRCCGGHGCLMSSGIAKAVVDFNTVTPIAEGDQIILALQTARFLVRSVKALASGKQVALQVMYLGQQLEQPNFEQLDHVAALVHAFKWRARRSVLAAAAKFEARLQAGDKFDDAWNQSAVSLVKAALDHCYFVILSEFVGAVHSVHDVAVSNVLRLLARHYALVNIRENGSDWAGVLTYDHVQAIDSAIEQSLRAIRPNAVALVDAFNIPGMTCQACDKRVACSTLSVLT